MWSLFLHIPDGYLIGMGGWLVVLIALPVRLLKLRRRFRERRRVLQAVHTALSMWSVLAVLTAIELGFALLYDTTDSFDMTNVSHRWFQVHAQPDLKALAFKDGTGLEYRDDREFPTRATLGSSDSVSRRHLCFLGDSFTFGHGVPRVSDRFSNQFRAQLESDVRTTGKYEVSNLSKPGSDILWGEAVLKQLYANGRQVDVAIYVMCLNDIEMFHDRRMEFNDELAALRERPQFFLWRDTYFFNWAYYRLLLLKQSKARNYYDFVRDYYAGSAWQQFATTLSRVDQLASENDSQFVVVVFPFLHNLGERYPFVDIHAQIRVDCEKRGINCVDLLPQLQRHAGEGLTVNPFDAHPNERAHQLVADELLTKLRPALEASPPRH